jgi:hypothetical protein
MSRRIAAAALCAALLSASGTAQAPANNSCTSPLTVFGGVNPQPPAGASGQSFTNVGATNSASGFWGQCNAFNKDVWFEYVAARTGTVTLSTCTPPGFATATLSDTILAVYPGDACGSGGPFLACNDDGCPGDGLRSSLTFSAYQGASYLIRVGSFSATLAGAFYLTVDEPTLAAENVCSGAITLVPGVGVSGSMDGTTSVSYDLHCPGTAGMADVWYKFTVPAGAPLAQEAQANVFGAAADQLVAIDGACGTLFAVACGGQSLSWPVLPGHTYYVRVLMAPEPAPTSFSFAIQLDVEVSPPNDACATAVSISSASYPFHPSQAVYFTNVGADTTPGLATCVSTSNDVWFSYVATATGEVSATTVTPAGQIPGALADSVLSVWSSCGGTLLACNDDSAGGLLSSTSFYAVQGTQYLLCVSSFGDDGNEGSFWLTVRPKFSLTFSAPSGPGSLRLRDDFGGHFHAVYNCLTLSAGSYPYGPFFGIEPTATEIALQLTSNTAPFTTFLDGSGAYQFDVVGLPPLTLYGAAIEFDALGMVAGVSNAASFTVN